MKFCSAVKSMKFCKRIYFNKMFSNVYKQCIFFYHSICNISASEYPNLLNMNTFFYFWKHWQLISFKHTEGKNIIWRSSFNNKILAKKAIQYYLYTYSPKKQPSPGMCENKTQKYKSIKRNYIPGTRKMQNLICERKISKQIIIRNLFMKKQTILIKLNSCIMMGEYSYKLYINHRNYTQRCITVPKK